MIQVWKFLFRSVSLLVRMHMVGDIYQHAYGITRIPLVVSKPVAKRSAGFHREVEAVNLALKLLRYCRGITVLDCRPCWHCSQWASRQFCQTGCWRNKSLDAGTKQMSLSGDLALFTLFLSSVFLHILYLKCWRHYWNTHFKMKAKSKKQQKVSNI